MIKSVVLAIGAACLSGTPALAASQGAVAPVRQLVYSFTWGVRSDLEVQSSGIGEGEPASGTTDYQGGNSDEGTITVDVLRVQPDKGLIVSVQEQADHTRTAKAATCVVYGNTRVICDPNVKVNEEESTLLRFLGSNFIDPNQIDAKQHWQILFDDGAGYATTADYTIKSNDNGVMAINENRVVKIGGAQPATISMNATVEYNFNRSLPTSINAYTIERDPTSGGMGQYQTLKSQTVLHLQSDSQSKR